MRSRGRRARRSRSGNKGLTMNLWRAALALVLAASLPACGSPPSAAPTAAPPRPQPAAPADQTSSKSPLYSGVDNRALLRRRRTRTISSNRLARGVRSSTTTAMADWMCTSQCLRLGRTALASPPEGTQRAVPQPGRRHVRGRYRAGRCRRPELGLRRGCAGDYDNDGRIDLYVTCFGPNRLYRGNRGDGTMEQVA